MRRILILACFAWLSARPGSSAESNRDRLARYFSEWFSVCPATKVAVTPASEIAVPGYETWRVARTCELKNRNEVSITFVDTAKDEVFVGEVLHDDTRKDRPFSPAVDLPVLRKALAEAYGVPVTLERSNGSRGPWLPVRIALQQAEGASASLSGFVSQDGATLLVGDFRPLGTAPNALRRKMLAESPGVRPQKGAYYVTAFIDFQCERCRQRTPEIADFAFTHGGGALEYRFLPLVKVHDWAFAAAEAGAALANVSPSLYGKYEEIVFHPASGMTAAGARQAGADVAEAAGVSAAFSEELSSGRARQRVVRDIELALRLGLSGTPVFFYDGAFLSSEAGIAEGSIEAGVAAPGSKPSASGRP